MKTEDIKNNKDYYIPRKSYFYSKKYLPHPCFIRPPVFINKNLSSFDSESIGKLYLSISIDLFDLLKD